MPVILWAFALQISPILRAFGPAWHIDFALLVVVAFTLIWGGQRALLLGFITGLMHDALSSQVFGLNTLSKSLVGFVVLTLSRHTLSHNAMAQRLAACVAIGLDTCIRLVVLAVLQTRPLPLSDALRLMVPYLLLGMVTMPWICQGFVVLARALRLQPERGRRHVAL
jgi:rod shape-determining protein MreD